MFVEATQTLKVMHAVAMGGDADSLLFKNRRGARWRFLAIVMPGGTAAVWSPRRGFTTVALADRPDIVDELFPPRARGLSEIAQVTRRAILPQVFTQLYSSHPTLATLAVK